MFGLSLAVDPRSDLTAEKEPPHGPAQRQQTVIGGVMGSLRVIKLQLAVMGSLRVIKLQLVAFIMMFSASSLVPIVDMVFPAFFSAYILALSRLTFPAASRSDGGESREVFNGSRAFQAYVVVGTNMGLFLPLAYKLEGFKRGDEHAVRFATLHLFLLSFHMLTENVISGLSPSSLPVRAMVPLLYTVQRIFVIADWIFDVWFNKILPANASIKSTLYLDRPQRHPMLGCLCLPPR